MQVPGPPSAEGERNTRLPVNSSPTGGAWPGVWLPAAGLCPSAWHTAEEELLPTPTWYQVPRPPRAQDGRMDTLPHSRLTWPPRRADGIRTKAGAGAKPSLGGLSRQDLRALEKQTGPGPTNPLDRSGLRASVPPSPARRCRGCCLLRWRLACLGGSLPSPLVLHPLWPSTWQAAPPSRPGEREARGCSEHTRCPQPPWLEDRAGGAAGALRAPRVPLAEPQQRASRVSTGKMPRPSLQGQNDKDTRGWQGQCYATGTGSLAEGRG